MTPTTDVQVPDILGAFHFQQIQKHVKEYLGGSNQPRFEAAQRLQAASRQKIDHESLLERLHADRDEMQAALDHLGRRMSEASSEISERKAKQIESLIAAARSNNLPAAKLDKKLIELSVETDSLRWASTELTGRIARINLEIARQTIEVDFIEGSFLGAQVDVLDLISVDLSAPAVALQGAVVLDRDAGRSGVLRRQAAALLDRYQQHKRDFDQKQFTATNQ